MQLVDANVLLHAVNEDSPHHREALGWLDSALTGAETVGFAWVALLAFVRVATHPAVFARPLELDEAFGTTRDWLDQPTAVIVEPTERHVHVLRDLLAGVGTAGNLVNDAHLAALSLEHGCGIVSYDADFARFPGVRWRAQVGAAS